MQKKRERLRSRHFLFLHVSTSKLFCVAEWKAPQERICESDCGKRKGSDCAAGISFSCMFQRANISAQQKKSSARADLRVCLVQKKRERLRSRHFLFLHVSTNKLFCVAEWKAPQERICESDCGKRKGSGCIADISFSCMFQRANVSAQQKGKLCRSGFASLSSAKEKGAAAQQAFPFLACFNEQIILRSRMESSAGADLRVCLVQKKRERLRSRHFLFLHVSTSKYFCAAEKKALQERICESVPFQKRERLRNRHFLFLHVSTSKCFCAAEKKALQERICSFICQINFQAKNNVLSKSSD